jgi:hypothetical protein
MAKESFYIGSSNKRFERGSDESALGYWQNAAKV